MTYNIEEVKDFFETFAPPTAVIERLKHTKEQYLTMFALIANNRDDMIREDNLAYCDFDIDDLYYIDNIISLLQEFEKQEKAQHINHSNQ